MKKFVWSDAVSVSVEEIDNQHKHFFDIANQLIDMLEQKTLSREALVDAVTELNEYANTHFETEEHYFEKFHYQEALAHKMMHNQFREKAAEFLRQVQNERADLEYLTGYVALYAGDWLMMHIKDMDQKFTEAFHSHGLR